MVEFNNSSKQVCEIVVCMRDAITLDNDRALLPDRCVLRCESHGRTQTEGIKHLFTLIKSYNKTINIFKQ